MVGLEIAIVTPLPKLKQTYSLAHTTFLCASDTPTINRLHPNPKPSIYIDRLRITGLSKVFPPQYLFNPYMNHTDNAPWNSIARFLTPMKVSSPTELRIMIRHNLAATKYTRTLHHAITRYYNDSSRIGMKLFGFMVHWNMM